MELRLDAAKWRKRRGMRKLLKALGSSEGLTRYVGGAVRDDLVGLPVSDIDLATRLQPPEVIQRLEATNIKTIPTGIDHGTVTAVSDGQTVEITSLRRDVSTDGRRATIAFTDDWKEDAARRDFTINALLADPETGEIFDFFGGLDDLQTGHIHFIGEPLERIAEDHLRILRFFRFHARFGSGEPDRPALDACAARANDLMALSRERIADELLKLLGLPDPAKTMAIMLDRGILKPVLPEIEPERLHDLETLIAAERSAALRRAATARFGAGRNDRVAPQTVQQGAETAGQCSGRGLGHVVAGPRLSRRYRKRGRPAVACWPGRASESHRRVESAAPADQWRGTDGARLARGPDHRPHAAQHRAAMARCRISQGRRV